MLNTRPVLRSSLIVHIPGSAGDAMPVAVAAEEGDFPLAFALQVSVQRGSPTVELRPSSQRDSEARQRQQRE